MENLVKAFEFALAAHTAPRKGGDIPYIVHPMDVASILLKNKAAANLVIAGLLHDTIEDTAVTFEDLKTAFGIEVATLVRNVSEPDHLAKNQPPGAKKQSWKRRKEHTIDSVTKAPLDVKVLACADKLANIRDMITDYHRLGEELWKIFNAPKEDHRWYYTSLLTAFEAPGAGASLAAHPIYQEFKRCVGELFDNKFP